MALSGSCKYAKPLEYDPEKTSANGQVTTYIMSQCWGEGTFSNIRVPGSQTVAL